MIRIGLDAMGGDFAPEMAIQGAIMALDAIEEDCRIVLFGDEDAIRHILEKEGCDAKNFDIVATTEVIEMGEHPVRAFQQKQNSSIVVGFNHLAMGEIDGFASAGSTGAMTVGSMQIVGMIDGVMRPAISAIITTSTGSPVILLDVGLNVDCKPNVLEQYALIGSVYAESVLGISRPRVALVNIGVEPSKGNLQAKSAYKLLQAGGEGGRYNFVGNVEASHLFTSKVADIVVCDGFVGNTILKMTEGLYSINKETNISNQFWEGLNYEHIGGTPVLGINAPVVIGHGKSSALAIKNMLLTTADTVRSNLVQHLKEVFE